mmetsp:Transcript_50226/g.56102  ORF Transcript_50226/g.56102 Transcript_50226/m.56102 type:complete len:117 (-) Transcript_50226:686-1036(-)
MPREGPIQTNKLRKINIIFALTNLNGTKKVRQMGIKIYAPMAKQIPAFIEISVNSSSVANPLNPNQIGVPTAPQQVAKVLKINNKMTDSNLGCPVDMSIGAPSATGVPNPEAPSTM